MEKTKILFISRAYPPIVGGIENQNYELGKWLGEIANVTIVANTRGRKFLPFFAPYALVRSLFSLSKFDVVLLGDGVLAFVAWTIKLFSKKPVICVVHGLDINYNSSSLGVWYEKLLVFLYQKLWVNTFLPKIDFFIAVGNETVRVAIEKGISEKKIVFIPNGVDTEKHLTTCTSEDLARIIGKSVENKKILLTSGRLAKRKGVAWFVENVMSKLSDDFIYLIAGSGPEKEIIKAIIEKEKLEERVLMLGYISDEDRNTLFCTADLFVQPNIKVQGDMEGFGISVIEAGACRLPVLASNIEGLKDAIKDEQNGFLVESGNSNAYIKKIQELFANESPREIYGQTVRDFVIDNYRWEKIAAAYLEEIQQLATEKISPKRS